MSDIFELKWEILKIINLSDRERARVENLKTRIEEWNNLKNY